MNALTILCVDDEQIVLRTLKEQLRRHLEDVQVETAEAGEEALELFQDIVAEGGKVPLVISDQLMPGMRGEEFLAQIHDLDPTTLNVLLTGQATADAVGAAVNRARLYRYIGKPWSEDDLLMTAREAVRAWKQAREIEEKEAELLRNHEASLRFVPREFLEILGHARITDVQFGDFVEEEVNILFSDMRGYSRMVEGKSPAEAFAFLNDYLQLAAGPIRENDGFVSNIEGDAILALFPGTADTAIRAGIAMQKLLRDHNGGRAASGEPPVGMGIGVNSGRLLLGTVGGADRLQCDVVGTPVNICARIEALTKTYGTGMLVSGQTLARSEGTYACRELSRVRLRGTEFVITLHEVLEGLPDAERSARLATADRFADALARFRNAEFTDAVAAFESILDDDPGDRAARVLAERCRSLIGSETAPSDFDADTV